MKIEYISFAVLVILVVISTIQVFQLSSLKKEISGNVISGNVVSGGQIDTRGWTANEIMQYEHHGTIPARFQSTQNTRSSGGSMVGGC